MDVLDVLDRFQRQLTIDLVSVDSSLAVSFYHMLNVSVVSMFRLVAPSGTASLT